jgi:DNA-binding MarR family transcriptional regulator
MTTMVRLCERDGLVRREPDPDDARATRVVLTERAQAFRPVAGEALAELDRLLATALGAVGIQTLRESLKGVVDL